MCLCCRQAEQGRSAYGRMGKLPRLQPKSSSGLDQSRCTQATIQSGLAGMIMPLAVPLGRSGQAQQHSCCLSSQQPEHWAVSVHDTDTATASRAGSSLSTSCVTVCAGNGGLSNVQEVFDAIICDPPYGIRAGGKKSVAKTTKVKCRDTHIPSTEPYTFEECLKDLLHLAAKHLKLGGRLVFFLPSAPGLDKVFFMSLHGVPNAHILSSWRSHWTRYESLKACHAQGLIDH